MKTTFILTLAAGFLLATAPRHAFAQATEEEAQTAAAPLEQALIGELPTASSLPAAGNVEFRHWHQGEPPLQLIRQEEGFCALTSVGGGFAGGAESVGVYVGDDGYWYLGGKSRQHGMDAECVVVRYPSALHGKKDHAKRVKILAASFGAGSRYADVTARVKTLLHEGKAFRADPAALRVDPANSWRKTTVIFYKVGGKRALYSVGEDEFISKELLVEKARAITDQASTQTYAFKPEPSPLASGDDDSSPDPEIESKTGAQVRRPLSVNVPEQIQDQDDQENRAQTTTRAVTPAAAVAPGGERSEN